MKIISILFSIHPRISISFFVVVFYLLPFHPFVCQYVCVSVRLVEKNIPLRKNFFIEFIIDIKSQSVLLSSTTILSSPKYKFKILFICCCRTFLFLFWEMQSETRDIFRVKQRNRRKVKAKGTTINSNNVCVFFLLKFLVKCSKDSLLILES